MRPTVVDAPWSVCLSIGHTRQLNGRTYRDAVWGWMGMGSRLEMPRGRCIFLERASLSPLWSTGNIWSELKLFGRWQQWSGLLKWSTAATCYWYYCHHFVTTHKTALQSCKSGTQNQLQASLFQEPLVDILIKLSDKQDVISDMRPAAKNCRDNIK